MPGREMVNNLLATTEETETKGNYGGAADHIEKTYGDWRSFNTLTMEFYNNRQGVYETIRHDSHHINKAFISLKSGRCEMALVQFQGASVYSRAAE
ncbi:hypothetical protein RRG08_001494 [Elysia crispata]|uniref:Uncharacterized protein n=1 Tax=Elysia crispata TaxID=231223 RepID=A0AAE1DV47_9GAST|nr:hypothetical protein RRG08_001494 [Elysia crispata]